MTPFYWAVVGVVVVGFTATALASVIRIIRGPTILDRMVASDMLLTTLVLAIGCDMVLRGHTYGIAWMTAIAATSVLATIVVARYVRRRSETVDVNSEERGGWRSGGDHV